MIDIAHNTYTSLPVLVTGGCGFIGSHIVEKLVLLGAQVTIIDNLSTGSLSNIESIKDKVTFIQASITDKESCLLATQGQQIIFHLAALVSVAESVNNPALCYDVNINGTFNILEAARINKVKKFILSSSSAVYGNTEQPCSEQIPCQPESPYGFSKYIDELLCKQYAHMYGLETLILRYFNVYGPRQNPHGSYAAVVAKFTEQIKKNLSITIFGDGQQTRDFIHVNDVVNANLTLAMTPTSTNNSDIFNIGTGKSMTLLELIDRLKQEHPNYTKPIHFEPARAGDLKHSKADCSKFHIIHNRYSKEFT